MTVIKFAPGLKPVLKHQEHDQQTHGSWANGVSTTQQLLLSQASKFETYEQFHVAVSLGGLRPRAWHIADKGFELDPKRQPTDRIGSKTQESGLFLGDPEYWQEYATGREIVIEYDVSGMTWTKYPLSDTGAKADFYSDQSGNQGFFVRSQGFGRLKEVARLTLAEAISRSRKQQDEMPDSKAKTKQIWDESRSLQKHAQHDQSTHGNWADGSQGLSSELSDDEIRDVIYNSKTVNEMFEKVAKRQGKSMKPSVDNLSENEITHYRGVQDVDRDAQRLLDGKIKFTEFQTWGQGIYLAEDKSMASNYGTLIGMKLDASAKIVRGETAWDSAFDVSYDNPSARTRNTTTSNFIDLGRIETQIRAGKMDNLSISDMRNVYWAAKGYDGFTTFGETVLFNGSKLTINRADIGTALQKHAQHNQQTHGNWATGGGGAGVDITGELDELFFNNKLDIKESKIFPGDLRIVAQAEIERVGVNKETVDLIEKMSEAQIASGQAYADNALKLIAEKQGFTGKPKVVETVEDLEEVQRTDGGILVYRGLANYSKEVIEISARQSRAEIDGGKPYKQIPQILRETKELEAAAITYTAEQALTDFREGEYFGGWGVFGNGTYTTVRVEEASTYTQTIDYDNGKLGNGKTVAMLIPRDAKAPSASVVKEVVKNMVYGGEPNHRNNVGRMLASMGYQYYDAGYVQSDKGGIFVVLDRSMLTVAEKAVD